MSGEDLETMDILNQVKKLKPKGLILGTHHFVHMSEVAFDETGLVRHDLGSVLWITPVGASVPPVSAKNIKKLFRNMAVCKHYSF